MLGWIWFSKVKMMHSTAHREWILQDILSYCWDEYESKMDRMHNTVRRAWVYRVSFFTVEVNMLDSTVHREWIYSVSYLNVEVKMMHSIAHREWIFGCSFLLLRWIWCNKLIWCIILCSESQYTGCHFLLLRYSPQHSTMHSSHNFIYYSIFYFFKKRGVSSISYIECVCMYKPVINCM